jgi:hypothetical protein
METFETKHQTKHASKRLQQRGVTSEALELHEQYADKECFVGGGLVSRTLTDAAIEEMKLMGVHQQKAEKVRKMAVIYTPNDRIITILFVQPGQGKTYRRGSRKRYEK